ncbi:MAG: hypothetical protein Q4G64_07825 [bacterium]|nr:hypothetical protein [bacterium]
MAIGYTNEEVRDAVYEYLAVPHGSRRAWLVERGIPNYQMYRWRRVVLQGDLDRGLVPRAGAMVSVVETKEMARLIARVQSLEAQLAAKDRELVQQAELVNALGKALGLLERLSEREQLSPPPERGSSPN